MKKTILFIIPFFFLTSYVNDLYGQLAFGLHLQNDLYLRYQNPKDEISSRSAGSALINIGLGPKIWIGSKSVAFSAEAAAMISPFALSLDEFKGLGAVTFPVMGKINFLGLTTMDKDAKFGFALGGGWQWSRTELFGIKNEFDEKGVTRSLFRTYVVELDLGYGLSGFNIHGFVRYGWNNDIDANTFNFGIAYDFNLGALKKYTDPEF